MGKKIKFVGSIVLTIAFLVYVSVKIQWQVFIEILDNLKPSYILIGVMFYFLSYILRATRLKIILHDANIGLKKLIGISLLHNFYNRILPARLGDFTLVYYLRRDAGINFGSSVGVFFILRVYDFLISIFLLSLSYSILFEVSVLTYVMWCATLFMLLFSIYIIEILNLIMIFSSRLRFDNKIFNSFRNWISSTINETRIMKKTKTKIYLLMNSLGIWVSILTLFMVLLYSSGVMYGFWDTIFASTFANFSWVLPINGVGGFGTMEASWGFAFSLRGYSFDQVFVSALYINTIVFIATILFAVIPYLMSLRKGSFNQ